MLRKQLSSKITSIDKHKTLFSLPWCKSHVCISLWLNVKNNTHLTIQWTLIWIEQLKRDTSTRPLRSETQTVWMLKQLIETLSTSIYRRPSVRHSEFEHTIWSSSSEWQQTPHTMICGASQRHKAPFLPPSRHLSLFPLQNSVTSQSVFWGYC